MKIAFLTTEYVMPASAEGGLANYLKKTAAALCARGCQAWVFVASERDARWQDGAVTVCEVRHRKLPAFLNRIPLVAPLVPALQRLVMARAVAAAFWKAQRQVGFDLVQSASYQAPGYALLGNGSVPVVCRISSYTPLLLAAEGSRRNFAEYLLNWMELRQVIGADAAFAPSSLLAGHFRRLESCEAEVVRTPPDQAEVEPDDVFFEENRPKGRYLLFFGTLNRVKGVDLLAPVLPAILTRHPELSCVFIGRDDGVPGGGKLADLLRQECRDFLPRLFFFPALGKSRLYPFIGDAEAVLMPSRSDNYPNACLEALQLGTPVVGADGSSIEEIVTDGVNGVLFRNGDSESLRDGIERVLNLSPTERAALKDGVKASMAAVIAEDRIGQLLGYYGKVARLYQGKQER